MTAMTLEARAAYWAGRWHGEQVRKYTGEPYINHPRAVAELVRSVPHDEQMLAAAWLHDVREDCGVSHDQLCHAFGFDVADLVGWLTDVSKPGDGKRAARKAMDRQHIAVAPIRAKTIKLADLIDNSHSIIERDPGFAKVYIGEKRLLLPVLHDGDPTLLARAKAIVDSQADGEADAN